MYKMQNFNLSDMLASFIMTGKCRVLIWLSHLPLFMPCDVVLLILPCLAPCMSASTFWPIIYSQFCAPFSRLP